MLLFDPLHTTPEYGEETEIQFPFYQPILSKGNGLQKIINLVLLQFCSHSYCPPPLSTHSSRFCSRLSTKVDGQHALVGGVWCCFHLSFFFQN